MEAAFDVVVVGGGLAGLRSAVSAAMAGARVCLAVDDCLCSGASFYPGMEMVACQCGDGTREGNEAWLREIGRTSCGLASPAMNRIYVENIRSAVDRMPEIGIERLRWTTDKTACFAGQPRPTVTWGSWDEIRARARQRLEALGVAVLEHARLLAFLREGRAVRGCVLGLPDGVRAVAAGSVVAATGGLGNLYRHNLNPPSVAGQGQALALAAGASLINVEFLQFIPGFLRPAYKTVFREMSIPYVQSFSLSGGEPLLSGADAAECLRLRATHGPFSCETLSRRFDIAMMQAIGRGEEGVRVRYDPAILEDGGAFIQPYVAWLRQTRNIDLSRDEILIAPFYHASNGGIRIDSGCRTELEGLYACGEVCGGIHGANRQGGMSTGSCLVFGDLAGKSAAAHAARAGVPKADRLDARDALREVYGAGPAAGDAREVLAEIQNLMGRDASIIRSADGLRRARERLQILDERYRAGDRIFDPARQGEAAAARCAILTAGALLAAMENRRESRGAHYREDFPDRDEVRYGRRFRVLWRDGEYRVVPEEDGGESHDRR